MRSLRLVDHLGNPISQVDQSIDANELRSVHVQGMPLAANVDTFKKFLEMGGPLAEPVYLMPTYRNNRTKRGVDLYQSSAGAQWAYNRTEEGYKVSYIVRRVATHLNRYDHERLYVPLVDPLPASVTWRTVAIYELDPNAFESDLRNDIIACQLPGPENCIEHCRWEYHTNPRPSASFYVRFETQVGADRAIPRYLEAGLKKVAIVDE